MVVPFWPTIYYGYKKFFEIMIRSYKLTNIVRGILKMDTSDNPAMWLMGGGGIGILKSASTIALPLDGNPGGLPEMIIDPNKVNMRKYMGAPGKYNSYWGF